MTDHLGGDTEFSELVDADVPRVDLVGRPANGSPGFLLMKQAAGGLLDAAHIRELLAKSEPDHDSKETVTMTGSPGAIAKLIHQSSAPVVPVAKELDLDDSTDGLDITVPLAAPDDEAPGDPTDPGSPAWEAIDAATARKWTAILARAGRAIALLAERETLEAASADPGDIDNAWDLEDANCAIDYAISVLAPFAVAEQSEADCGVDEMAAVGKALDGFDSAPLDTIEVLAPVAKAGRVLSAGNEAAIRGAVESLQKVLSSLPAAPTTTEESGQPVAKETAVPETATPETAEPLTVTEAPVVKADGEKVPQVAVYDKSGKLVGIVDPADIVMIADAEPETDEPEPEPAAPEATDLAPAPAAEVGIPAGAVPEDDVAKQTDTTQDVLKSIAADAATAALDTYSATQEQVIAKQAEIIAQLAEDVKVLKGQVVALEEQPAMPKVLTNGAMPPSDLLRGQNFGAQAVDVTKAAELKKSLMASTDAVEQRDIAAVMNQQARFAFDQLQTRG